MGLLAAIDEVLSQRVGHLNTLTYGVDCVTVEVNNKFGRGGEAVQALNYIARPIDILIQIVTTLIFSIYQAGKTVYKTFTDDQKTKIEGLGSLVFSPIGAAINIFENLKSVYEANNSLSPYYIFTSDFVSIQRVEARKIQMEQDYPIIFGHGKPKGELPDTPHK